MRSQAKAVMLLVACSALLVVAAAQAGILRRKKDGTTYEGSVVGTVVRDGERHFVFETRDGKCLLLRVSEWVVVSDRKHGDEAQGGTAKKRLPQAGTTKQQGGDVARAESARKPSVPELKRNVAYVITLKSGGTIKGRVLDTSGSKILVQVAGSMQVAVDKQQVVTARETELRLPSGRYDATVMFVQVFGPLEDPLVAERVCSDVAMAKRRGATVVVLEIDTPGGRIDLAKKICSSLESLRTAKTVALVSGDRWKGAFSAGAFIALACDEIYLAPTAAIGAALPFVEKAGAPKVDEKLVSAFCATMRAVAAKKGHPPELAAAMVDPDVELREVTLRGRRYFVPPERVGEMVREGATMGRWVTHRGKLLTLTAGEACDLGLASGKATSRKDILTALGFKRPAVIDRKTSVAVARGLAAKRQAQLRMQALYGLLGREWRRGQQLAASAHPDGAVQAYRLCASACVDLKGLDQEHPDLGINMTELRGFVAQLRTALSSARLACLELQMERWRQDQMLEELVRIRRELEWLNTTW